MSAAKIEQLSSYAQGLLYEVERLEGEVSALHAAFQQIAADDDSSECCRRPVHDVNEQYECCGKPTRGFERAQELAQAVLANALPAEMPFSRARHDMDELNAERAARQADIHAHGEMPFGAVIETVCGVMTKAGARIDHLIERVNALSKERAELAVALKAAKQWLFDDDGSPLADENTRALVNDAIAKAEREVASRGEAHS